MLPSASTAAQSQSPSRSQPAMPNICSNQGWSLNCLPPLSLLDSTQLTALASTTLTQSMLLAILRSLFFWSPEIRVQSQLADLTGAPHSLILTSLHSWDIHAALYPWIKDVIAARDGQNSWNQRSSQPGPQINNSCWALQLEPVSSRAITGTLTLKLCLSS